MNGTTQSDHSQNLWRTPKGDSPLGRSNITVNKLIKQYNLKLDPAASGPEDAMTEHYYTIKEDGLKQEWTENSIFNPPFSKMVIDGTTKLPKLKSIKGIGPTQPVYKSVIGDWVKHAVEQSIKHKIVAIGILPVYTSLAWYHQYIQDIVTPIFIYGRIHYIHPSGKTGSPNFDSMIVIWDGR